MNLETEIQKALDYARAVSAEKGADSRESAAAWDIVEELQAEASHQHNKPEKTTFEQYCEDNPDAFEARIYED
jgi:hypothetical protein